MSDYYQLPENLKKASREQWQSLVEKTLRDGQSIDDLSAITPEGIEIEPLYTKHNEKKSIADAVFLKREPANNTPHPWQIIQLIDIPDIKQANQQIAVDFAGGASALMLAVPGSSSIIGGALNVTTEQDFLALLNDIDLSGKSIYLTGSINGPVFAASLSAALAKSGKATALAGGSFGLDPLANYAASAGLPQSQEDAVAASTGAAQSLAESSAMKTFMASGRIWHQAGASGAAELACTMAAALSYWRAMEQAGLKRSAALNQIAFSLTVTSDIFLSAAKLRAMRALWAKVTSEAGANSTPIHLIAELSPSWHTKDDAEVNMLRGTAATAAAAIGNVDGFLVLPFSAAHGVAARSARRLALNTHLIAVEESHLGDVKDPAHGSHYIETLTEALAEKAWVLFRDIEKAGGLFAALKAGTVQNIINEMYNRQVEALREGNHEITGVTSFPNKDDRVPDLMPVSGVGGADADLGGVEGGETQHQIAELIGLKTRIVEPFERQE